MYLLSFNLKTVIIVKYIYCDNNMYLYVFLCRFDILKKLGEGSCGKVQLGICKETEQLVSHILIN